MKQYDVIVCGGGTAGIMAAVASARSGAITLLIERDGYLGGTATYGLPMLGFFSGDGDKVVGGLAQEIVDRMISLGGCMGHARGGTWKTLTGQYNYEFSLTPYDPEVLKIVAQEMALESGVTILFQSVLIAAETVNGNICSVEIMTVEGRRKVSAKVFIDATGDAFLTWMAGFPTERRGEGKMQNVTNIIRVGNVDAEQMVKTLKDEKAIKGLRDWHIRLVRGKLLDGKEGYLFLAGHAELWEGKAPVTFTGTCWRNEEMAFNITRTVNVDPTLAENINRGEISERKNIALVMKGLRARIPGCEKAYLISSSPRVGIREGRRIRGIYTLTEQEVINRGEFPDGIARGSYPIDIHDPKGGKTQFTFIKAGGSYAIPYRCLIPEESNNLLVAGRCVSTTGKALGSVRLIPCCMALGQAAGTAAAFCASNGLAPSELSTVLLRDKLLEDKAILAV
jgi:hypothetical protein